MGKHSAHLVDQQDHSTEAALRNPEANNSNEVSPSKDANNLGGEGDNYINSEGGNPADGSQYDRDGTLTHPPYGGYIGRPPPLP